MGLKKSNKKKTWFVTSKKVFFYNKNRLTRGKIPHVASHEAYQILPETKKNYS